MFRAEILCRRRDTAEIHEGPPVLLIRFRRIGIGQADLVKLTLEFIGSLGRPHPLEDLNDLATAGVADLVALPRPGHVRRDDVDTEPPLRDVIYRGEGATQHGRPDLTHAQSDELIHLLKLRSHRGGKRERILPHNPARGQEDVLIPEPVGHPDNITTVLVATAERAVGHAEVFVVVAAESGEPGHFDFSFSASDDGGRGRRSHTEESHDRSKVAIFDAALARTGISVARKRRRL